MEPTTTSGDPQAGDPESDPQPQAGTTPQTEPQAGDSPISLDEAKKLRQEANSLRQRLRSAEAKAKEFDDFKAQQDQQNQSELEKTQKRAADAEKARDEALRAQQELRMSNAVTLAAGRLNFNDPDDGMRYIKTADLEDDLSNVGDLLKQVLKERPYLAAGKGQAVQTSGGATNPSRSQSTAPQALTWDVISRMNPQEYEARRGEIQKYIADHPFRYGQR